MLDSALSQFKRTEAEEAEEAKAALKHMAVAKESSLDVFHAFCDEVRKEAAINPYLLSTGIGAVGGGLAGVGGATALQAPGKSVDQLLHDLGSMPQDIYAERARARRRNALIAGLAGAAGGAGLGAGAVAVAPHVRKEIQKLVEVGRTQYADAIREAAKPVQSAAYTAGHEAGRGAREGLGAGAGAVKPPPSAFYTAGHEAGRGVSEGLGAGAKNVGKDYAQDVRGKAHTAWQWLLRH
jgi:hypothetical protein